MLPIANLNACRWSSFGVVLLWGTLALTAASGQVAATAVQFESVADARAAPVSRNYLKTQQERLEQVQRPLAADSVEQLRAIGHKMKGTGTSYGFARLTALGAALEEAAKAGDLKQVDGRMVAVERYLKYASDYLCEEVAPHERCN